MRLCELKGRFLFEADPFWGVESGDSLPSTLNPQLSRLTTEELIAWGAYYEMGNETRSQKSAVRSRQSGG